jgi:ubiquinone/menaquinone biosynthesis C-methylase UbiE
MNSFVIEEITEKLLQANNIPIKTVRYDNKPFNKGYLATYFNNRLAVTFQEYLSSKYSFTPPSLRWSENPNEIPELFSNKGYDTPLYDNTDFAIYLFQCNALLNVECIEFDNTCFVISKRNIDIEASVIPQPDGLDYIIGTDRLIDINFINTPCFMLNNIVHPVSYDTKTLYLLGLYHIFDSPSFNKDLMPFGESIYTLFKESKIKMVQFKDVVKKLILSQFPSFNDYFNAVLPALKTYIYINGTSPSEIRIPKYYKDISFKSPLLNSINEDKIEAISDYDKKLLKKYEENLSLPFVINDNKVYSYPGIPPVNKDTLYYCNSALNYEIFIKLNNRLLGDLKNPETLEYIYKVKKSLLQYLKPYHFSNHMKYSQYGSLYSGKISRSNDYYPTWTLNQINSIKNKEDLFKLIIKTVWHNNKFIASKLEKELKSLTGNDLQIYNRINELYKQNKPRETGFDRGQFRFEEINKLGLFSNLEITPYTRYLDFGGGIGDVSSSIAKNLKLKKENSFVTDIQNWLGKEHADEYVKYITYRYLKTDLLPFEEGTFNLITCLQVLHHIPDKKYTISQLRKIINSNGILIVREHDCRNIQDRTMIDIEHSLHAYAVDEQGIDYFQNYHDNYMSKSELESLMTEGGFELVNTFPEKGLTRYYYSVWRPSGYKKIQKVEKKNWADYSTDEEEEVDLNLDKNKQPNLTFKQLSKYDKEDVVTAMKPISFPYHKYYINTRDYYFTNLKNFKYSITTEIVDTGPKAPAKIQGIYFKSPITYIFKEPELFGLKGKITPTLLTMKEDYNAIDVITNLFTEEQRMKAKVYKGKSETMSPFDFWMTQKSKIIDLIYTEKQPLNSYTLREAIFNLVPEATLFKTTVAKSIYDIFKPKHILDMSSGWGDRMIAAIAYGESSGIDVKYSGFDPNSSLKYEYMRIATLAPENKRQNFKVRTEPFESANLKDIKDVDLFFSSPPYFDFEIYTNEETQSINNYKTYPQWVVNFLFKSIKNAFSVIVKDGYFVMHITDTGNMRNVCELIKLYIEEYLNGSYIGCIFTQAPGKRRHPMWVFKNSQDQSKNDKIMNKLYPEISNLILKEETTVKPSKQPLKKSPLKREEPLPPGFFNF